MPEVTVIIPTYNCAAYLPAALDSVLTQSFTDLEALVIDDGSTDETEALMRSFGPPVRYLRQPNRGVAAARNRGLAEAAGKYLAFLDADDLWEPHKLERQLDALANAPGCRACYTACTIVGANLVSLGIRRGGSTDSALEELLTIGNVIGTPSTVLAERTLFQDEGGFDLALSQCADWDMWLRLARVTDFCYLDEPLVRYRQHDGNMSRNVRLLEQDSLLVLEKGFALAELPAFLRARRRKAFAHNYMVLAGSYYHARAYRATVRCLATALVLDPRQLRYAAGFPARFWNRRLSAAES